MLDYLSNLMTGATKNLAANGVTALPPTVNKSIWSHLGNAALAGQGLRGGLLSFAGERARGGTPLNFGQPEGIKNYAPGHVTVQGFGDGSATTGGQSNLKAVGGAVAGKALGSALGLGSL